MPVEPRGSGGGSPPRRGPIEPRGSRPGRVGPGRWPVGPCLAAGLALLGACAGDEIHRGPWPELPSGLAEREPLGCALPDELPERLSDHPCFDGHPAAPVDGFVPYGVQAPFWSDGLAKDRFLGVPDGALLRAGADGAIELPPGSLAVKVFRDGERRIETRLIAVSAGGAIEAATYVWTDDQADALRTDGGAVRPVTDGEWTVPSAEQCFHCHTAAAGDVLGLRIPQLNGDLLYPGGRTANQIATWVHIGLLDAEELARPADLDRLAAPGDPGAPMPERARAYLDANCAHCHRPGSRGGGSMDLRWSSALRFTATCNIAPEYGDPWDGEGSLLAPGRPDRSVLLSRVDSDDALWRMPPLGSSLVDPEGSAILAAWITELSDCGD